MDVYLKSGIETGLLTARATHDDVAGRCAREKCSWEPFHTLAICSRVEDADGMLVFEDGKTPRVLPGEDIGAGDKMIFSDINFHIRSNFFAADRYQGSSDENYTKLIRTRSTPNNTKTNLPDLAQVYLAYFDPCIAEYAYDEKEDRKGWKAHKATFNLCVQTHNTSYNTSGLHTTVLSNNEDVKWSNETVDDRLQYCTQLPGSTDRFCMDDDALMVIGGQMAVSLETTAFWGAPGDHYYVYTTWAPNLGSDVLGRDPGICSTDEYHGIKGFERRANNIATSLSNA
jgi:hypothetical protein